MAMEVQVLVNNYGLPLDFAQRLLQFMGNDLENAIQVLEESEKNMVVLKAKFLSNRKGFYGAFLLFYNFRTNQVEYVLAVVTRDAELSRVRLDAGWQEVFELVTGFVNSSSFNVDLSSNIEQAVLLSHNQNYINSFFVDPSQIDMVNIKRFLLSEIGKVLQDTTVVVKVVKQDVDVFKFRNLIRKVSDGIEQIPQEESDRLMLLTLSVDPVLSPIGGIDIDKVVPGMQIKVKINDERDVAYLIGKVLGAVDSVDLKEGIYGRLVYKKIVENTDNVRILVEFGPGIYGTFRVGSKVRVDYNKDEKIVLNSNDVSNAKVSKKEKKKDDSFKQQVRQVGSLDEIQLNVQDTSRQNMPGVSSKDRFWSMAILGLLIAIGVAGVLLMFFLFL